jgi:hypothetical protein
MTSVRLPKDLEQLLEAASRARHKPKTYFVKEALVQYFYKGVPEKTAWETGEPYFGQYGSGDGTLSTTYKERLKEKNHAGKHSH